MASTAAWPIRADQCDFITKFAYEILPTPIALGRTMIISILFSIPISFLWDSDCATAFGGTPRSADAESIAIPADHLNMVKFASCEDG